MILPAFGIVSHIIPTFARKPLFGYDSMVYAVASIAFLSFIVWAHHMFTVGMPLAGQLFFMYSTMLIAIPTGVKVFNWTATMWQGSMSFETPMLFAIAFVVLFTIGGFSGLMLAIHPPIISTMTPTLWLPTFTMCWFRARSFPSLPQYTFGSLSGPGKCITRPWAKRTFGYRLSA